MTNNQLLLEAIALKKCVTAVYNNVAMKLAPHVLYSKHSALFVDAVILEKMVSFAVRRSWVRFICRD